MLLHLLLLKLDVLYLDLWIFVAYIRSVHVCFWWVFKPLVLLFLLWIQVFVAILDKRELILFFISRRGNIIVYGNYIFCEDVGVLVLVFEAELWCRYSSISSALSSSPLLSCPIDSPNLSSPSSVFWLFPGCWAWNWILWWLICPKKSGYSCPGLWFWWYFRWDASWDRDRIVFFDDVWFKEHYIF